MSKTKLFSPPTTGPKILFVDIETAPLLGFVWGLWENNVAIDQIHTDWYILSWSAKWYGSSQEEVMYQDQRYAADIEDDKDLLKDIWTLLDQADIVVWQNGKKFDDKKLNARFILNGFQPPSTYRQVDTLEIAKRRFGFTSNKLEYMSEKLCTKYKKLKHKKYPGFSLWRACLQGEHEAWEEMEAYNTVDVLALEELYEILRPWDNKHPNTNIYYDDLTVRCRCGSTNLHKRGFAYTNLGKYQLHRCKDCGGEVREKTNLLDKEKRQSLRGNLT